ncbi:long-chain-fatty-acid--CoA ligase [Aquimarina aquimarini]|uniref:long-chain-fatty-acid--CoA ligase n=1 Tax=Aquimarina aquimarini TaxID=1191734 RepID=UPI000D54D3AC|nr:long-chain-fatty-acid--CoA ligase [Aquimarina aquimarini]
MKLQNIETLAEASFQQAQLYNDKTAFIFNKKKLSYRKLNEFSNQVANALINENIKPNSRITFLGKDSLYSYEILFGSVKAKTVFTPINWRLTYDEILFIITNGESEIIFVEHEFLPIIEKLNEELVNTLKIIVINNQDSKYTDYLDWRSDQSILKPDAVYDTNDIVVQIYTSGTTGRPKGVQIGNYTFFQLLNGMRDRGDLWVDLNSEDKLLLSLPIFHIGGMWWTLQGFLSGSTGILIDAFIAWKVLELIEQHKITKVGMVPSMIQFSLLEPSIKKIDVSSVNSFLYGGSPISPDLLKQAMKIFKCDFFQMYGMTETGNMAVCLRPKDHQKKSDQILKSAGKPLPGVEIQIVDVEGNIVTPSSIGEIWIKSPSNMVGYWKNEQANDEVLVDGWIRSGDAGYLDEDGYLFICDRIKDMIIYAGENIYPAEIENILSLHKCIKEVAVIGIPDEKWGEIVKAFVVTKEDSSLINKTILVNFLKGKIADFKIPKSFSFIDALPRNSSGKILKTELKKPFWKNQERLVN